MSAENPNALILFGRGVARGDNGWRPTPLIELLGEAGHSGILELCPDTNNPKTTIGGGNANTLATYHKLENLNSEGLMPSVVIIAAGRPAYLQDTPSEISEGSIMWGKISRNLESVGITPPEAILLTQNKNTKDDVVESLRILAEKKINKATIITISTHVQRAQAFLELALLESGSDIDVNIVAADEVLSKVDPRFKNVFDEAKKSAPYQRSDDYERKGAEAIGKVVESIKYPFKRAHYHGNIQNAPERPNGDKMIDGIRERYQKQTERDKGSVWNPPTKP